MRLVESIQLFHQLSECISDRYIKMMGSKFANVVVEIIERHRVAAPTAPRDFIFYFSGISEGQFGMIPDCYMCPISNRLSLLTPLYAASVTALGVWKR